MAYQRNGEFEVAQVAFSVSDDKEQWRPIATVPNRRLGEGSFEQTAIPLSAEVGQKARYLKLAVHKTPQAKRILLGEIVLEGPRQEAVRQACRMPPTPMQVKRVLDDALLNAGVQFLYGCYATELLVDRKGNLAGIVMANRSGRQAVVAKVLIDATPGATVAKMAGARMDPFPPGTHTFKRIVIGGRPADLPRVPTRQLPTPIYDREGRIHQAIEYTLDLPMNDGSFASYALAEQIARDMTWDREQVDSSETLFEIPTGRVKGKALQCCEWPGADKVDLDVFRPERTKGLYVLSGCADVTRRAVEKMLRPLEMMRVGERIGAAAAADAKEAPRPDSVRWPSQRKPVTSGDVATIPPGCECTPAARASRATGPALPCSADTTSCVGGVRAVPGRHRAARVEPGPSSWSTSMASLRRHPWA